ncbi:MAG: ABC transporter permease [Candidatus Lokiarchaeota archaeon]|nr:ABC transporter permease [Candidatus Lokiarchaeota archaeon]MCK4479186.1 ABC transporter permease [Candidatus Lokiarchaeota archaeon]MCK4779705.1 ABC transporter permease [Candidatus Lokiarchaeota archaeon]
MANEIIEGILEAIRLIFTFDPEVWGIIEVSFRVSLTSTFLAALVALPIGSFIGLRLFKGKKVLTNLINTFMGFPPVVMGLIVYLLLSRNGPFGTLGLLYSTTAMIVAQFLLAVPIIMGTAKAAIESVDPALKETVLSLGANERQLWWELIKHSKKSIIAGFLVAFGQAISEVGAVMIVGGNIRWETRTFTTSIVLQTRMGEFGMAIALGVILITIAFIVNYGFTRLQTGAV